MTLLAIGFAWGIIIAILAVVAIIAIWPSIKRWSGRQIEGRDSYDKRTEKDNNV